MTAYIMEEMTWPEVRDALEEVEFAILPVGSDGPAWSGPTLFPTWSQTTRPLVQLASDGGGQPVHLRVLGLTLSRAWRTLFYDVLPSIRAARPTDLIDIKILQIAPTSVHAQLNPSWPGDITDFRQKLVADAKTSEFNALAPVRLSLREYDASPVITGWASGPWFFGTLVGDAVPARPTMTPYFLVGPESEGAAQVLRQRCESCWEHRLRTSRAVWERHP